MTTQQRLYVIGFFLGAAGVLLAGQVGGPGWGVLTGSVWATMHAVVLLLPARPRPGGDRPSSGAKAEPRSGVTR